MFKKILLGSVMAAAITTGANALIIDDFSDAAQSISINGPLDGAPCAGDTLEGNTCVGGDDSAIGGLAGTSGTISLTAANNAATAGGLPGSIGGSILGGYRDITTTLVQSPADGLTTNSQVTSSLGFFSHSQASGVYSNSFITWDGNGEGLNADLSGFTHFHLVVLQADAGVDWSLQLFDGDDQGVSDFTYVFSNDTLITSATHLYIPFSVFVGINFSDIERIIFGANINSEANFDTSVSMIEVVVPEPASMSLLGAGIMGLGYFGKRRKG